MSTAGTQPECFPFLMQTNGYVIDAKSVPAVAPKPTKTWFSSIAMPRLKQSKPWPVTAAPAKPKEEKTFAPSLFL